MHVGEKATHFTDTSERARQRYYERVRETPPVERLRRALQLSAQVRRATFNDVRRQHPGATERQLAIAFVRRVYGDALANRLMAREP